jgi:hypothetical protein
MIGKLKNSMFTKKMAILAASSFVIAGVITAGAAQAQTAPAGQNPRFQGGQASNVNRGLGMFGGSRKGQGITGKVTAISDTTITIQSAAGGERTTGTAGTTNTAAKTYTVDASKATFAKLGEPTAANSGSVPVKPSETTIAITDIAVGDSVMVKGTVTGTNIAATSVTVMPAIIGNKGSGAPGMGKNMIMGKVTAISNTTLTVQSELNFGRRPQNAINSNVNVGSGVNSATTYTVDASSATIKKFVAPTAGSTVKGTETTIAVTDIAVGDTVRVQGTVDVTNVKATTIVDGVTAPARVGNNPSNLLNGNPQAAALKNEVEAVKPDLWNKIVSFFSGIFGKHK